MAEEELPVSAALHAAAPPPLRGGGEGAGGAARAPGHRQRGQQQQQPGQVGRLLHVSRPAPPWCGFSFVLSRNDDEYAMADPGSEPESDSDFEYEGRGAKRGKGRKSAVKTKPTRSGRSSGRRLEDEMPRTPVTDRECRRVMAVTTELLELEICFRFIASLEARNASNPGNPAALHDSLLGMMTLSLRYAAVKSLRVCYYPRLPRR